MRYHRYFLLLVALIGLVSVNSVFGIAAPSVSVSDTSAYPYDAEITGDSVFIRTGPGTDYYEFGKLFKGDKVRVVGDKGAWSKILPPQDSFSWISAQYVTVSASDPTIGEITDGYGRVWAGSPLYSPERSTTPQGKLSKGAKVKIIGPPVNNYYKIAVPKLPDAYYWVSTQYTKPIQGDTTSVTPRPVPSADPIVMRPVPASDFTNPNSTTVAVIPVAQEVNGVIVDSNSLSGVGIEVQVTPLDMYYVLQKQVDEERSKPYGEQDYSAIKEALQEIVNDKTAEKASIYAKSVLDRIEGIELALQIDDILKEQNDLFKESKEKIEKAYTKKLEEVKNLGKYAVIGTFKDFPSFGNSRYRILDSSDATICSAIPSQGAAGKDYSGYFDKKIGLVGSIEPDIGTSSAVVYFTEIVVLD